LASPSGGISEKQRARFAGAAELDAGRTRPETRVSRQTVNAIVTGKYPPSLPLACKIAKIFRKPVEEIFKA
jgi:transcriptional regulator with XRE-family HTH domain